MRSGDKGRGKDGEPRGNFEPGTDIAAKATVLAEGCWGHLTDVAVREFDLDEGREPQVWELGVKEVWKVKKPLDRVIHTLAGWPLKISAKYHQIGGSWIYPMKDEKTGEDLVSIGWVLDLDYADATTSAHDLLQQFKTHPLVRAILEGGERVGWGAKAIPAGGYWAMPKLSSPGAVIAGDAAGMLNLAALKGVHYAIKAGMLAAEEIYASLKAESNDFSAYEEAIADSIVGKDLYEQRNTRQPFQKGPPQRRAAGQPDDRDQGPLPRRALEDPPQRRPADVHRQDQRGISRPTASTPSTSSPASSSAATSPATTRRTTSAYRSGAAGDRRDLGLDVSRRRLRDPRGRAGERRRRRDRQLHQLRPVRRDHRQGRPPHPTRGRRRPALPEHLTSPGGSGL